MFFFPMADQELLQRFREQGCTAYQGLFASEFLRPESPRYHLLGAPVGSGKIYVATRVASYMLKHELARRVLVLTPSSLAQMWHVRLAEACEGMPSIVVSRPAYRELLARTPVNELPWRQPLIAVAPIDTAKQDDIAESFAQVHWDLVIIDEAHLLSGPHRMALLRRLMSANAIGRLLLMTATPLPFFGPFLAKREEVVTSPLADLAFTNWFTGLRNWEGELIVRPPVRRITVEYQRGPDEVAFLQTFCRGLGELTTNQTSAFVQTILVHRAASSIFAVEQSLRRLQRTLALRATQASELLAGPTDDLEDLYDDTISEQSWNSLWENGNAAIRFVESSLNSLEQVQSDEKLASVTKLLQQLLDDSTCKICVISSYVDSLNYLHSAISDLNITAGLITGGQIFMEREEAVRRFLHDGRLLLATDAVMEGFNMAQVNHVIHFDLPQNPNRLMQRQGRFDRIGRTEPLSSYHFRDTSGALPSEQQVESTLSKIEQLTRTENTTP